MKTAVGTVTLLILLAACDAPADVTNKAAPKVVQTPPAPQSPLPAAIEADPIPIKLPIAHEEGFAYVVPFLNEHRPRKLRVFEDGQELGPADALHDDIRKQGQGRYSFWNDTMYFSASDNTDPNTNGRTYDLR